MASTVDSTCKWAGGCSCSARCRSDARSILAGAVGGILAIAVVAFLGALLLRRFGPKLMPRVMKRMMRDRECSAEMRACMEACGCGPAVAD